MSHCVLSRSTCSPRTDCAFCCRQFAALRHRDVCVRDRRRVPRAAPLQLACACVSSSDSVLLYTSSIRQTCMTEAGGAHKCTQQSTSNAQKCPALIAVAKESLESRYSPSARPSQAEQCYACRAACTIDIRPIGQAALKEWQALWPPAAPLPQSQARWPSTCDGACGQAATHVAGGTSTATTLPK